MATAATDSALEQGARSRWALACAWLAGLVAYSVAIFMASGRAAMWINDIAWTLAPLCAALTCLRTTRQVESTRRRAWRAFTLGCVSWLIGQLHWNYSQLVLGVSLPFPSIGQPFFSGFAACITAGVLLLPESRQKAPFTFKQIGNLGLVSCCLAVTVVIGVLEPALQSRVPPLHLWVALVHTVLVTAAFLVALYSLWTHRWGASWRPMLLLVVGTGIYAVANLVYGHALLTRTYLHDDLVNISWLVVFGLVAVAAREQAWLSRHGQPEAPSLVQVHERWLEAVVPALLIIIMVGMAVGNAAELTPRMIASAASLFILFAIVLGAREAWIQSESQQLTHRLVMANEQLQSANTELRLSEARYRELNAALEQRVAARTTELKRAYEELEGFSYAVAHDLKAPLRAINGFAHLLEAEMDAQLSERAREHLARIRNGSVRMATLIEDLLAYSHVDRRELQSRVIGLPALIDTVVAQHAEELQRRRVALVVEAEPLIVRVDADGLSLALRNLFENALKYTRERSEPQIEIRCRRSDAGVLLSIADNGIGFDMEYQDYIFKLFQRLHRDDQYPGTGIGLALVRKAIERIGGRVWAQSKVGEGATFHVELPRSVLMEVAYGSACLSPSLASAGLQLPEV
jgi:signal transduction histidine kinase